MSSMNLPRRLKNVPACHECRKWLWNSFVSSTGLEVSAIQRSQHIPSARRLHTQLSSPTNASNGASRRQSFSHTSTVALRSRLQRTKPAISHGSTSEEGEPLLDWASIRARSDQAPATTTRNGEADSATTRLMAASGAPVAIETTSSTHVPWYLQHKSDLPQSTQPTTSGQEMPEIPEHSPALLEPVIKHVLDTLGLAHLTVLDLRRMTDPPPALGANLLMVIATARSERHLHASADKLCRWLRTEYKLTPFADGLLGRNEMKIAIRRRTKKAKMMSAVGANSADTGDIADGLRSGWICVNIGRVEGGMLPDMRQAQADRKFVGFGTAFEGSTIVVQMMTEEKREEIDMEGLWDDARRRQERNNTDLARPIPEDQGSEESSAAGLSTTSYSPY